MQQVHDTFAGAAAAARPEWCSQQLAQEIDAKLERSIRAHASRHRLLGHCEDLKQVAWLRVLKCSPEQLADRDQRNGYLECVASSVVTDAGRRQRREAAALERLCCETRPSWACDETRWILAEFLAATLTEMATECPHLAACHRRWYLAEVNGTGESYTAIAKAYAAEHGHPSPSFLWHERERWVKSARCARLATAAF
jgi:hypothetical protein